MNIKQQIKQVIAYAHKEAEVACVHHRYYAHLDEIASRLYAIVEEMEKVEPVAWMFLRAYGNGLSFARPDDYEDEDGSLVTPTPLYAAPQVPDGMALVPLTPTRNMIEAGIYAQQPNQPLGGSGNANRLRRRAMRVYGSMLSAAAKEEADEANPELAADLKPEDYGLPQYPEGEVTGPCVCGGWPGGKCLRCKVVKPHRHNTPNQGG